MAVDDLLPRLAATLSNDPSASMSDIATRIGVGRTTLHRHFSSRSDLAAAVARFAVEEVRRIYDLAGIDDRPVRSVVEAIAAAVLDLAVAYRLLWADPPLPEITALRPEWERDEARLTRFAARAQADGLFRRDMPAPLIAIALGSHAFTLWYAVSEGHIGERAAPDLFLALVLEGVGAAGEGRTS